MLAGLFQTQTEESLRTEKFVKAVLPFTTIITEKSGIILFGFASPVYKTKRAQIRKLTRHRSTHAQKSLPVLSTHGKTKYFLSSLEVLVSVRL